MVEYLYNAIKAVAGQDMIITSIITDEEEELITEDCCFMLHDEDGEAVITVVDGVYNPDYLIWEFTIPANATLGLKGRYWYCIQHNDNNLCFKQPIYLV